MAAHSGTGTTANGTKPQREGGALNDLVGHMDVTDRTWH
jgi:hypothetical protein